MSLSLKTIIASNANNAAVISAEWTPEYTCPACCKTSNASECADSSCAGHQASAAFVASADQHFFGAGRTRHAKKPLIVDTNYDNTPDQFDVMQEEAEVGLLRASARHLRTKHNATGIKRSGPIQRSTDRAPT